MPLDGCLRLGEAGVQRDGHITKSDDTADAAGHAFVYSNTGPDGGAGDACARHARTRSNTRADEACADRDEAAPAAADTDAVQLRLLTGNPIRAERRSTGEKSDQAQEDVVRKLIWMVSAIGFALLAAACGSSGSTSSTALTSPSSAPTSTASDAAVAAGHSKLGTMLVDAKGRSLYLFEADKTSSPTCYDACASAWPSLPTNGSPSAGTGLDRAKLGTATRRDGTTQLTYGGHPLYYFSGDTAAGDVKGQGINAFGAKWYVVAPSGKKIDTD